METLWCFCSISQAYHKSLVIQVNGTIHLQLELTQWVSNHEVHEVHGFISSMEYSMRWSLLWSVVDHNGCVHHLSSDDTKSTFFPYHQLVVQPKNSYLPTASANLDQHNSDIYQVIVVTCVGMMYLICINQGQGCVAPEAEVNTKSNTSYSYTCYN